MFMHCSSASSFRASGALVATGLALFLGGAVAQQVGGGSKGAVTGAAGGATS